MDDNIFGGGEETQNDEYINSLEDYLEKLELENEVLNSEIDYLVEGYESETSLVLDNISQSVKDTRNFNLIMIWFVFVFVSFYIAKFIYKHIIMKWINRLLKFKI